jgi:hypothetical protein
MARIDIFRLENGGPLWLRAAESLTEAKRQIGSDGPGKYLIFDSESQKKIEVSVEARTYDGEHFWRALLVEAMTITEADLGTLQIYLATARTLELVCQIGFNEEFVNHFRTVTAGDAACGTALAHGTRVSVYDVENDPIYSPESRRLMLANGARSLQSVPLRDSQDKLVGMLSPQYKKPKMQGIQTLSDAAARRFADQISSRF